MEVSIVWIMLAAIISGAFIWFTSPKNERWNNWGDVKNYFKDFFE